MDQPVLKDALFYKIWYQIETVLPLTKFVFPFKLVMWVIVLQMTKSHKYFNHIINFPIDVRGNSWQQFRKFYVLSLQPSN